MLLSTVNVVQVSFGRKHKGTITFKWDDRTFTSVGKYKLTYIAIIIPGMGTEHVYLCAF